MFGYDADNDRCFELHAGTLPASRPLVELLRRRPSRPITRTCRLIASRPSICAFQITPCSGTRALERCWCWKTTCRTVPKTAAGRGGHQSDYHTPTRHLQHLQPVHRICDRATGAGRRRRLGRVRWRPVSTSRPRSGWNNAPARPSFLESLPGAWKRCVCFVRPTTAAAPGSCCRYTHPNLDRSHRPVRPALCLPPGSLERHSEGSVCASCQRSASGFHLLRPAHQFQTSAMM